MPSEPQGLPEEGTVGSGAYGPFGLVVESGDGLAFFDPESEKAHSTFAWMERIMAKKHYRSLHFRELVGVEDERATLVGVIGIALHPRRHKFIPDLWQAVDRGADASPQLIYLLRQTDPDFVAVAKDRIAALCDEPEASAPKTPPARTVSALLAILATVAGETAWTESRQRDPEVSSLLASLDSKEPSVTRWGSRFEILVGGR